MRPKWVTPEHCLLFELLSRVEWPLVDNILFYTIRRRDDRLCRRERRMGPRFVYWTNRRRYRKSAEDEPVSGRWKRRNAQLFSNYLYILFNYEEVVMKSCDSICRQ